jgi:hypothetical protein
MAKACERQFREVFYDPVSTSDIKAHIDKMTEEERFFAAAYLQHLAHENDPTYKLTLAERMKRMDEGHKVTLEQAQRIHDTLESEGL